MARGTKEDVETIDDEDPRNQWPSTTQVADKLGCHKRTIENLVRSGKLRYVYGPNSERRFNPEDIATQADDPISTASEEIQANLAADVIVQLRTMVKDLVKAQGDLLRLATEPAHKHVANLLEDLKNTREENHTLRQRYLDGIEAFEKALTTSHERELARARAESQGARLDKALDKALEQLPTIVAGFSGKKAVSGFIDALTGEQKQALFDMLTAPQAELLLKVIGKHFSTPTNGVSGKPAGDSTEGDKIS